MLTRMRSFARAVLGRSSFERDMDDELRFHLETRAADLVRRGLASDEAARRARLEFGPRTAGDGHRSVASAEIRLRIRGLPC